MKIHHRRTILMSAVFVVGVVLLSMYLSIFLYICLFAGRLVPLSTVARERMHEFALHTVHNTGVCVWCVYIFYEIRQSTSGYNKMRNADKK